jgi:hypothetical protein
MRMLWGSALDSAIDFVEAYEALQDPTFDNAVSPVPVL